MRKIVDLRLALTIILDTMLVLSQFVFQGESMGGAVCMQSLADPGAEKQETNITTFYSFPLTFMITFTEGCFENQTTHIYWDAGGLLADLAVIGVLGALPYWFLSLKRRLQRHDKDQTDLRK